VVSCFLAFLATIAVYGSEHQFGHDVPALLQRTKQHKIPASNLQMQSVEHGRFATFLADTYMTSRLGHATNCITAAARLRRGARG
jgi:hypothetical protein